MSQESINEKKDLKANLKVIVSNLKKIFKSKDKKLILQSIGYILFTLFVAIIIKIPFIFIKTLVLDFLNSNSVMYIIQNIVANGFEFAYIFVAIIVIYRYLKKYFGNN